MMAINFIKMAFKFVWFVLLLARVGAQSATKTLNDAELKSLIAKNQNVLVLFCDATVNHECSQRHQEVHEALKYTSVADLQLVIGYNSHWPKQYRLGPLPQVMYYRSERPVLYHAEEGQEMADWLDRNREIATRELTDDTFEHDTQAGSGATTGDWFVLFYGHSDCSWLIPTWDALADRLKQKLNVAAVNIENNPQLKERFSILSCPTIILFHHGSMYTYDLSTKDIPSLVSFAEGWYKNVKAVKVPGEPSPFDQLTENVVLYIKDHLGSDKPVLLACIATAVLLVLVMLCCCVCGGKKTKSKVE